MQVACFSFSQVFLFWSHFEKKGWRDRWRCKQSGSCSPWFCGTFSRTWSIVPTRFHAFITWLWSVQVRNSPGPGSRQTPCTCLQLWGRKRVLEGQAPPMNSVALSTEGSSQKRGVDSVLLSPRASQGAGRYGWPSPSRKGRFVELPWDAPLSPPASAKSIFWLFLHSHSEIMRVNVRKYTE